MVLPVEPTSSLLQMLMNANHILVRTVGARISQAASTVAACQDILVFFAKQVSSFHGGS